MCSSDLVPADAKPALRACLQESCAWRARKLEDGYAHRLDQGLLQFCFDGGGPIPLCALPVIAPLVVHGNAAAVHMLHEGLIYNIGAFGEFF